MISENKMGMKEEAVYGWYPPAKSRFTKPTKPGVPYGYGRSHDRGCSRGGCDRGVILLTTKRDWQDNVKIAKETAFLVRIFHVFLWTCSKLEHGFTRKAG